MPSHAARRFSDNVHNIISLNHIVLCYKGFVVPASGNWGVFCRDQPGFTRIPKSCFKFGPYGQVRCWHDCNFSAFSDETSLFSIHYHFTYSHVCVEVYVKAGKVLSGLCFYRRPAIQISITWLPCDVNKVAIDVISSVAKTGEVWISDSFGSFLKFRTGFIRIGRRVAFLFGDFFCWFFNGR